MEKVIMAGKVPDDIAEQFANDTFSLKTHELAKKYEIKGSTVSDWRLDCKRRLGLKTGYGTGGPTVTEPAIKGLTASYEDDPEELWREAIRAQKRAFRKARRREKQSIELPNEPCGIAILSDLHFGDPDTDHEAIKVDAEIIRSTEGLYAGYHGDGLDNWIVGKLQRLQRDQAVSFDVELALFKNWLELLKGKLLWAVSGNHDNWTYQVAGVDLVKDTLKGTTVLYDQYEVVFRLMVGKAKWIVKARHQWKYGSVFNATHGQEVGWERGGTNFDIALGGHTHIGTLCRPFFRQGKKRYAILMGTYKVNDDFPRQLGLPKPQDRGSGALLFHPDGRMLFIEDLQTAAEFLTFWRQ